MPWNEGGGGGVSSGCADWAARHDGSRHHAHIAAAARSPEPDEDIGSRLIFPFHRAVRFRSHSQRWRYCRDGLFYRAHRSGAFPSGNDCSLPSLPGIADLSRHQSVTGTHRIEIINLRYIQDEAAMADTRTPSVRTTPAGLSSFSARRPACCSSAIGCDPVPPTAISTRTKLARANVSIRRRSRQRQDRGDRGDPETRLRTLILVEACPRKPPRRHPRSWSAA